MKSLGEKLKKIREKYCPGEGLRIVAPRLGIDFTHLGKIEAGDYLPSIELLKKISEEYSLSHQELKELLDLYLRQKLSATVQEVDLKVQKHNLPKQPIRKFYRKVKKD